MPRHSHSAHTVRSPITRAHPRIPARIDYAGNRLGRVSVARAAGDCGKRNALQLPIPGFRYERWLEHAPDAHATDRIDEHAQSVPFKASNRMPRLPVPSGSDSCARYRTRRRIPGERTLATRPCQGSGMPETRIVVEVVDLIRIAESADGAEHLRVRRGFECSILDIRPAGTPQRRSADSC